MIFWIVAGALALVVAGLLAQVLLRPRLGGEPAAAYDLRVYRDQLKDVDRDLARGVIAAEDADRIRTEVSRRILAADAQVQAARTGVHQSRGVSVGMAVVLGVGVIAGSLLLYRTLGAPGYGDLGLEHRIAMAEAAHDGRPDQATAEASLPAQPPLEGLSDEYLTLIKRLRATVAERPDDLQGLTLLARNEAAIGNYSAARAAQGRVIELKGEGADPRDHVDHAEMLILAAGGYVSPEAEEALRLALEGDPGNGTARYYWGLMLAQIGRPDVAFRVWESLLRESPPDAPWAPTIRAQIPELARLAGVNYTMPPLVPAPVLPGPSSEDVAAAGEMSEEDRMQMVRNMVNGLSDRLASEGGSPSEWARLIGALGVLGETDQAQAVYDNALAVFEGNPAALDMIAAGAERAGLTP